MSASLALVTPDETPRARVLVVDDETGILRFFRAALGGYEVHTAPTPEEGLRLLESERIEIAFVDKNMPGMDGIEMLRRARAGSRWFEAVVMTGFASLDSAIEAVDLRVFRYLQKPLDLDEIRQAAEQAVERLREAERREVEFNDAVDQLIRSEQRRGASERLAAIGQMAATLTHEIANPLCYLESCLHALHESFEILAEPARVRVAGAGDGGAARLSDALADVPTLLGDCNDAADRLKRLVREARGMSRPVDRQEAVELRAVIADALRIAGQRIPAHVQVSTEDADVPPLHVDPIKLAQVVANLVVNGADAVPADGVDAKVTVRTSSDAEWAVIAVYDTGCGIPAAARDQLFTPFFTTKGARGGTGIGLSVCRDIVHAHGGRIEIESEPGRGSCFRVILPLRPLHGTSARSSASRARVLWIDGDRRTLAVMLRALGDRHQVVPATSADQALAMLRTDRRFDVVLCDATASGVGPAFWERVRALDATLAERIVFLRNESTSEDLAEFLRRERVPALIKPVSLEDLERVFSHR